MNGIEIREILSTNIKYYRENRKMSQADLAFEAGLSIPFLSDIERGNKWPSPDTIAKIANALKIEAFVLFTPKETLDPKTNVTLSSILAEVLIAQKKAAEDVISRLAK